MSKQPRIIYLLASVLALWSLSASLSAADLQATLVQTIRTSDFSPSSPDSSGVAYLPSSDVLLVVDSEVNEMDIFQGVNAFSVSRSGTLLDTFSTLPFSDEPTGVAINPSNGFCFFTDDTSPKRIYVVNPGVDGDCITADDSVTEIRTGDFGSSDPEDIAYGDASLFVVDGATATVHRLRPGNNGVFDGVPPRGDDSVSSFNTAAIGVIDPEGIAFNTDSGHLFIVGKPRKEIAQVTAAGQLLRTIGIAAANPLKPAGLSFAPGSINPADTNLYLVARGVDNDSNPNENDGRLYELNFPPLGSDNIAPSVDAGPDQTVTLPAQAVLNGSVVDDGLPAGNLSQQWSVASGPGTVTFSAPAQVNTNASFSVAGSYMLRLSADDGERQGEDQLLVEVMSQAGVQVLSRRVASGVDDAEERSTGRVKLGSSDLDMVDASTNQTVGMRFNDITIPQGAIITSAAVQFKVDEPGASAAALLIQGQAADNSDRFRSRNTGDISLRARTLASVGWSPAPWAVVGAQGADQKTSDIASIIQEIVDRPGWSGGNSLVLVVTGSGKRVAESYNGDVAGAPLLVVEYEVN